jgi:amphi-Trp domain-containing protein
MFDPISFERTQKTADVAARLRKLADELEQGKVNVVEQEVEIPEHIYFSIEFEQEHEDDEVGFEIEVAIGWPVMMLEFIDDEEEMMSEEDDEENSEDEEQ